MITLIRKELRGLRAYTILLFVIFFVMNVVDTLTKIPDQENLQHQLSTADGALAVVCFMIAFTLGLAMPAAEHDGGTIAFLDMLPTTRTRIYFAKVVAALLVFVIAPVSTVLAELPMAWLSRTSIDQGIHLDLFCSIGALEYAVCAFAAALGLGLSLLRRMAWAFLAAAFLLEIELERFTTSASLLKPTAILDLHFHGAHLVVPWRALELQGAVAVVAVLFGWAAFALGGDALGALFSSLPQSRRGRVTLTAMAVVVVGSWFAALVVLDAHGEKKPAKSAGATHFDASPVTTIVTARYDVRVRSSLSPRARAQILNADALAARVEKAFGGIAVARISVDATAPLGTEMNAGQTEWQSVSVDSHVIGRSDFDEVITHETAHVYANVLADKKMSEKSRFTRLFNEGLATVVAEDIAGAKPKWRAVAAFVRSRNLVEPELLFDDDLLRARLDPATAYALGRELVRATDDVGGAGAAVRVVKALKDGQKDLTAITLWRDAYQRAGLNLDRVLERFSQRLDDAVTEQRALLDALPRTFAAVEVDPNDAHAILIKVEHDGPEPDAAAICQVRPRADAPLDEMSDYLAENGACRVPRSRIPLAKAGVQVGWLVGGETSLFEPWTEVTLP